MSNPTISTPRKRHVISASGTSIAKFKTHTSPQCCKCASDAEGPGRVEIDADTRTRGRILAHLPLFRLRLLLVELVPPLDPDAVQIRMPVAGLYPLDSDGPDLISSM